MSDAILTEYEYILIMVTSLYLFAPERAFDERPQLGTEGPESAGTSFPYIAYRILGYRAVFGALQALLYSNKFSMIIYNMLDLKAKVPSPSPRVCVYRMYPWT